MRIKMRIGANQSQDWLQYLVALLVFLFPIVAAMVKGGSGTIFTLLFLLGLIYGKGEWSKLYSQEKWIFSGFFLLFLIALFSLINTSDMDAGMRKLERFLYFGCVLPVYLVIRHYSKFLFPAFLWGCCTAGFVYGLDAWIEVSLIGRDVAQGAYHKIIFGDIAILLSVILVVLVTQKRIPSLLKGLLVISAISAAYASAMSMTRGAWIFPPVALILAIWIYRKQVSIRQFLVGGLVIALSAIATGWFLGDRIVGSVGQGVSDIQRTLDDPSQPSSWGERMLMWQHAFLIWKQSPILGTGIGDYDLDRSEMKAAGLIEFPKSYGHAHSIYFDSLATMGSVGLIGVVLCLFMLPLWKAFLVNQHAETQLQLILLLVVAAFAVFGLTEGWLARSVMVKGYLLFFTIGLVLIVNTERNYSHLLNDKKTE